MRGCAASGERLLEADVAELRGTADTDLSAHIRGCEACTEAASRILAANAVLDEALGAAPDLDAAALVARARLQAVPGEAAARKNGRTARPWGRWALLGAAAALGGLLLVRPDPTVAPGGPLPERTAAYATVEAPPDRSVAVIQTDNPDITVLWFF